LRGEYRCAVTDKEVSMNWKLMLLGLALVGVAVLGWMWLTPSEEPPFELTLLHTNDVHSQYATPTGPDTLGGVARFATAIQSVRARNSHVLLLDAGDQFQGSLLFTVGGAELVADVMNRLGYDAMCLGNHEFDAGPVELAQFIQQVQFPVLSANIDAMLDPDLGGLILPYAVFTFDRRSVAVFGLTTAQTEISSSPGPQVLFHDAVDAARQTVRHLRSQRVDTVIALTHLGFEQDLELAGAVDGIDVIVGGHSHTLPTEIPVVVNSPDGTPVLVVTAYEGGRFLGHLDLAFNTQGTLVRFEGRLLPMDPSVPEDPELLLLLEPHERAVLDVMSSVVGATTVPLNGVREDVRSHETNLGNLICDAMLWKTRELGAAIALQNGGGIRASIPQGMITLGHVLDVLPYGNRITVLTLSGAELMQVLEHSVAQIEHSSGQFLQLGGLRFTYDPAADLGARVLAADVWDSGSATYVPLRAEAMYTVATNDFLADGGDGFNILAEAAARPDASPTGWLLSEALAEYLDIHAPVAPAVEGRIARPAEQTP
jgi:2',3'-cyclic-nucleotide 2'-phosphodiesterase (5'-nucleotidase family)